MAEFAHLCRLFTYNCGQTTSTKSGPSAASDESSSMKCPICTDQGFNVIALECGHLIPTPDPARKESPDRSETVKRQLRTPCGRLSRRGPQSRTFSLPPEVVVQRLELSRRSTGNEAASSGTETATPVLNSGRRSSENPRKKKKKKEPLPQPVAPDPRENGRILGSKVLPLMALLLQRQEEGEDSEAGEPSSDPKPQEEGKTAKDEKQGRRKLTIQCVQLLPEAEAPSAKFGSSRHVCHR